MSDVPDDLIAPSQAKKILRCCLQTVYRYALHGTLTRYSRAGKRVLVSEAEVRALLRAEPGRRAEAPPVVPSKRAVAARRAHTLAVLGAHGLRVGP